MKGAVAAVVAAVALWAGQAAVPAYAQATQVAPASPSGLPSALPSKLHEVLPEGRLSRRARLSVFGFQVYNASLWVGPGFKAESFHEHDFALELEYLRNFSSEDIARRSLSEMSRQREIPKNKAQLWERLLQEAIPDMRPGDRITGIHRTGEGMSFLLNGRVTKAILDPEFAQMFFGIWLAAATSEPGLRRELLSRPRP